MLVLRPVRLAALPQVERIAERHCAMLGCSFIAELIAQQPIYVPLLTAAAQAAIEQWPPRHA